MKNVYVGLSLSLVLNPQVQKYLAAVDMSASPECLLSRGRHCEVFAKWLKQKLSCFPIYVPSCILRSIYVSYIMQPRLRNY